MMAKGESDIDTFYIVRHTWASSSIVDLIQASAAICSRRNSATSRHSWRMAKAS